MATTLEPRSSEKYVDFDEYIDFQLHKTRSHIKWTDILSAVVGVAILVLVYLLIFTVLDHWVVSGGFGTVARSLMLGSIVLIAGGWISWKVVVPYLRRVNRLFAARVIEESEPSLKGTLINLIDLRRSGHKVPQEVRNAMEKRAAVSLSHMDVDGAVDRQQLMRLSYALLATVVLSCLYTLFSPKRMSFLRPLAPLANVTVATQTEIRDVEPGDVEILALTHPEVFVDLHGKIPEHVILYYTTADRGFVDQPVQMRPVSDEGIKRFRGSITGENGHGILQDMSYYIIAGDADTREFRTWRREGDTRFELDGDTEKRSQDGTWETVGTAELRKFEGEFRISVIQSPSAQVDEVRYDYPEYMRLETQNRIVRPHRCLGGNDSHCHRHSQHAGQLCLSTFLRYRRHDTKGRRNTHGDRRGHQAACPMEARVSIRRKLSAFLSH